MKEDPNVKFFVEPLPNLKGFMITREIGGLKDIFKDGYDSDGSYYPPRFVAESLEKSEDFIFRPCWFINKGDATEKAKELKEQFYKDLQAVTEQEEFIKNNPRMEI